MQSQLSSRNNFAPGTSTLRPLCRCRDGQVQHFKRSVNLESFDNLSGRSGGAIFPLRTSASRGLLRGTVVPFGCQRAWVGQERSKTGLLTRLSATNSQSFGQGLWRSCWALGELPGTSLHRCFPPPQLLLSLTRKSILLPGLIDSVSASPVI